MNPFAVFSCAYYVGRLADQGLANTLALRTLRHGTNPISWLSIHIFGSMPSMGSSKFGGDNGLGYDDQNKGRFYYARSPVRCSADDKTKSFIEYLSFTLFAIRALPKTYVVTSTANLILGPLDSIKKINNGGIGMLINIPIAAAAYLIGGFTVYILPSIKFRFTQTEVDKMKNDDTLKGWACSTHEWFSPLRIGTVGTLWSALSPKTFSRMAADPANVITGIAQLALCGVIVYHGVTLAPAFIIANKTHIVAGIVFGMF